MSTFGKFVVLQFSAIRWQCITRSDLIRIRCGVTRHLTQDRIWFYLEIMPGAMSRDEGALNLRLYILHKIYMS